MLRVIYALVFFSLIHTGTAVAEPRVYQAHRADQFLGSLGEDTVPQDDEARHIFARALAYDAAVFGRVAVLTYKQMYDQAIDSKASSYVGFNTFAHDRDLAQPGYAPFRSPNADTLYSNAYLDLSDGPVLLTVPDTNGRYYTVNFLDLYANATNISARTHGMRGGKYLIATTEWSGEVPEDATLFRVTQPYMWILMRIEAQREADLPDARRLQDRFVLTSMADKRSKAKAYPPPAELDDPRSFLRVLNWIVNHAGIRETEVGLVHRFRNIGVGGPRSIDEVLEDAVMAQGLREGLADANKVIDSSITQTGVDNGGWRDVTDIGRFGYNYLYRALLNTLGTGGNVRLENYAFTAFSDEEGDIFDGSKHDYKLHLTSVPPSDFFWSVTVYDFHTQELVPNEDKKYLVGGATPGLEINDDGSVTLMFSRQGRGPNVVPIPDGPFYLGLRAQGPARAMLNKEWRPTPVQKAPRLP